MTLLEDWKEILKKAWSVKFNVAALVFGCTEAIIALLQPAGAPVGVFAAMSILASVGALVARTLAQGEDTKALAKELAKEMADGDHAQ
jgi:hypothetical protein